MDGKKEFGSIHKICIGPFPTWDISSLQASHQRIHPDPARTHGLQLKPSGLIQILAAAHPLQFCYKYLDHSGHQTDQSPCFRLLAIRSNYFQLWPTFMPSPWGHFPLQRKEGDGNKFEKIMLRSTLPGQLECNLIKLLIQDCRGKRENFWTFGKHPGQCTPSGPSTSMKSAPPQMTSQQCRYNQGTPSRSSLDVTSGPWITWSW